MDSKRVFDVVFESEGRCVGKLRNEVTNTARKPFEVRRMLATDEGPFQGGEDTAPTPLEFFLTGLVGCLMTQIRVFAKRKKIAFTDLTVACRREASQQYQAASSAMASATAAAMKPS